MCATCGCGDCDCEEGIVQNQGDPGQPAFINLNFVIAGAPFSNSTASWVEAGRFIFSTDIADIFTSIRVNAWVSAGTGSFRIKDLISGNVIYTNAAVTSASALNIEIRKALQIYNAASALIAVEIAGSGANTIFIGSAIFAYEI